LYQKHNKFRAKKTLQFDHQFDHQVAHQIAHQLSRIKCTDVYTKFDERFDEQFDEQIEEFFLHEICCAFGTKFKSIFAQILKRF